MKVESKFNIGDVVATTPNSLNDNLKGCISDFDDIILHEVKEVASQTCYGGTQLFYLVTSMAIKSTPREGVVIKSGLTMNKNSANIVMGSDLMKFKEDELEKVNLKKLIIEIDKIRNVKK